MLGMQPNLLIAQPAAGMNGLTCPVQSTGIDDKSLKDIIDILHRRIEQTKNLFEFSQALGVENINAPTISGHTDFYYPNLSYPASHHQQELAEISKIKHIPIPAELIEQFTQMQFSCCMGLFTTISRAWLTIDNLIFFWNYEDGSDICFYDNLPETILAVELFVPKPGTFDDGIEYGLCLATNSSVVLLSIDFIRFTKGNGALVNEMRFSAQPVYTIPTDNLMINTLRAAKSTGRLFMGAKDGCLYEFFYQNETTWFSSQTKRVNLSHSKFHYLVPSFLSFNDADSIVQIELDESRNVLYTRSENSTIQVFYLGPNGNETSKVSSLTCNAIATKAAGLINSNDKHLFMPIVHIAALKYGESKNIDLVAVTQYGIRLYFALNHFQPILQTTATTTPTTTTTSGAAIGAGVDPIVTTTAGLTDAQQSSNKAAAASVPALFQLVHVRLAPNIDLSSGGGGGGASGQNGPISAGFYHNGVTLMISKRDEQSDSVLLLNRDLFLLHGNFKEAKSVFDVDGRIWCTQEIQPSLSSIMAGALENEQLQTATSASGVECIPKLSAEYFDLPRRFAMITPQGCFIWSKLRPVDQLAMALKESNGPNSDAVRLFFNKIYERAEACSLCLAVALSHLNTDIRVYEWATQAYFIYSGEPEIRKKSSFVFGTNNTNATNAGISLAMQQQQQQQQQLLQQQQQQQPQYQFMNPHINVHHDSGVETNENTIYGPDMTMHNNRLYAQQQQQMSNKNYNAMSYLNSPQQMSTPIMIRTKDQFGNACQTGGGAVGGQQQPLQAPFSSIRPQQQQQQPFGQKTQNQPQQQQQQLQMNRGTPQQLQQQQSQQQQQQSECEIFFSGKHDAIYIYLSRLLAPIWDLKLLTEIAPGSSTTTSISSSSSSSSAAANDADNMLFATFTEINIQWFLNKLNELRRFIDLNYPHLKTLQHSYLSGTLFGFNSAAAAATSSAKGVSPSSASLSGVMSSSGQQQQRNLNFRQQPQQQQQQAHQQLPQQSTARFATQFGSMPLNMSALVGLTTSGAGSTMLGMHSTAASAASAAASAAAGGLLQSPAMMSEEKLAQEIETGSILLLRQFVGRCIEILGLWKILDEHKFHFVCAKLERATQQLLLGMRVHAFLLADDTLLEQLITALLYRYIEDNASTDLLNHSLKQLCPSLYTNESAIFSKACERLRQALSARADSYEREQLLKEAVDLMKQIGYVTNLTQVCDMLYSAGCHEAIFELCLTACDKRDPQNIALHYYRKCEPPEDVQGRHYYGLRAECYKCMLDCLTSLLKTPAIAATSQHHPSQQQQQQQHLQHPQQHQAINTKEKLEDQINFLIKYIVNSKDELAHVSLFNWMISYGFEKKLVTLDSPFLENYLIREIKDQTKNRVFLDLLWRHYDFKKDYANAAKVLTALAEKYCESQITLKERVEYLTQAIVALNSSHKSSIKDEIAELNDKRDVALLQEKIYEELCRMDPKSDLVQDALLQLDSQLFDITKLYYEFAEKFDLFQCQLSIFKMARHEDSKSIEILWKQIIANELDKISSSDIKPSDIKNQLAENIVNIAKEYVDDDDKYFPLGTLIDSLEFVSLSRGFEPEWASNLLRKLNLSFSQLIECYNGVYLRKDIKWAENSSRFINAIYALIELFTKAPNATNENDKVLFLRSVKDLISKYLTELNAINDDLSKELISRFKTLNYMLERM